MTNSVERSNFFSAEDFDAALLCQERYCCVQAAPDGVYEIPLVLSDIADAADSDLPLPLPYRRLNADVLEYIEDAAVDLPKRAAARIVVYLPIGKIAPGLESRLNAYLGLYRRLRIDKVKRLERRALNDVLKALLWGVVFMLCCQIVRYFADVPTLPTVTSTISEGMLVLGWVALCKRTARAEFACGPGSSLPGARKCGAADSWSASRLSRSFFDRSRARPPRGLPSERPNPADEAAR